MTLSGLASPSHSQVAHGLRLCYQEMLLLTWRYAYLCLLLVSYWLSSWNFGYKFDCLMMYKEICGYWKVGFDVWRIHAPCHLIYAMYQLILPIWIHYEWFLWISRFYSCGFCFLDWPFICFFNINIQCLIESQFGAMNMLLYYVCFVVLFTSNEHGVSCTFSFCFFTNLNKFRLYPMYRYGDSSQKSASGMSIYWIEMWTSQLDT